MMGKKGISRGKTQPRLNKSSGPPGKPASDRALTRCTAELEIAQKELESFCYSVSHDLRAPLRSIDGFSTALLNEFGEKLEPQARDYLKRIVDSSRKMSSLIDELLTLSRIQRTELEIEDLNLSVIAEGIVRRIKASAPSRSITFSAQRELRARGDRKLLSTLLERLLDNAFKYTERTERAVIEFGHVKQGGKEVFFVKDNGAGFNPTYESKLFKLFQRLHSQTDFPGVGAGLAIARTIVLRHHGETWAKGAVDQGATIYFTLAT
jgi:light-regulated signal transduction histidine kinase (bacteriophytochrome)